MPKKTAVSPKPPWELGWGWSLTSLAVVLLLLSCLIGIWCKFARLGLLVDAITIGGIGGGFTLALSGGESYGLKFPGLAGSDGVKVDPGFIGDVLVGLMAGFLGIGIGISSGAKLFVGLFDVSYQPFPETVFKVFTIAFISGYLGLRLVKSISASVFRQANLEENQAIIEEKVESNETELLYLQGNELLREGQNEAALSVFSKVRALEGNTSIVGLIGMARAHKRMGKFGDAIAALDQALRMKDREAKPFRVAVAYWNRACYMTLGSQNIEADLDKILSDLKQAILIQPSFKMDLKCEEDLKLLQENPKFMALVADTI